MLAYLFWHQPRPGVDRGEYEEAQCAFHTSLDVSSACFRVDELPFATGGEARGGYEDWYLVEDWSGIGALNVAAVDRRRRDDHDRAASMAGPGWGGIYALVRGLAAPPAQATWLERPRHVSIDELLAPHGEVTVWQRQMNLGPAPEVCVGAGGTPRTRL